MIRETFLTICLASLVVTSSERPIYAESNSLEKAIAFCDTASAKQLLQAGADPNAKDFAGQPIIRWLASHDKRCDDSKALATARLLQEYGVVFKSTNPKAGPSLLVNLSYRHMPKTLSFLITQDGGDPTEALHAISGKSDLESIKILLSAGADPLSGDALSSALMDATREARGLSVLEMLKYVKDKQTKKVLAAYEWAKKKGDKALAQIFLDAGMKPPEAAIQPPKSPCFRAKLSSEQALLLKRLGLPNANGLAGLAGAMNCVFVQSCGDMVLIDCNSAADGPAYYINQKSKELVATCGGTCMLGCKGCPPKEWTCECKL